MMKMCVGIVMVVLGLFTTEARAQQIEDWAGEPLKGVQLKTVAFRGWVPSQTEPLRGTLILIPGRHGDGRPMAADPKWQDLAKSVGFALIACQFTDGEPFPYQNEVQGEVAGSIAGAVRHLGQTTKHPELEKAPLAFWGTSAGSNVSVNCATYFPARVIAIATSKGTSGPMPQLPPGKDEIPMFFAIGEKDKPEWVAESKKNIDAGLKKRAPWTIALSKSEGHEVGKSLDVARPFLKAAIEQRFMPPKPGTTGSAGGSTSIFKTTPRPMGGTTTAAKAPALVKLEKIDPRNGWLGDPDTYDIGPVATFKGNRAKAVWLPDEATALAWQNYLK